MRDRLKDILTRHCITVRATEYVLGRRKLSRISLVLPPVYEGHEFVIMPREVLEQLERELRLTEISLKLTYGKYLSVKWINELIHNLDLEDKVEIAHKIVEEVLWKSRHFTKNNEEWYVAVGFSGGKSSLVTLDIVKDHVPRDQLLVVYEDTGLEFPGNTEYVIKVVKEYYRLKLVHVIPKIKPFQLWKLFGMPKESRVGKNYEPVCCMVLKKWGAYTVFSKFNVVVEFSGVQATESYVRMHIIEKGGCSHACVKFGGLKLPRVIDSAFPLAIFTDRDVWEYIRRHNLPVNPVYQRFGISRQGCMLCTNNIGWRENLERVSKVLGRDLVRIVENFRKKFGIQTKPVRPTEVLERIKKEFGYKKLEDMYIIRVI